MIISNRDEIQIRERESADESEMRGALSELPKPSLANQHFTLLQTTCQIGRLEVRYGGRFDRGPDRLRHGHFESQPFCSVQASGKPDSFRLPFECPTGQL
jgi:hypothetical protein